ncbi:MAG: aspartate aminotransferase family protein [Bacteroidota bacterium]|nr:aspartate aminotransferase family protein [Bacteroidota bacterium]
MSNRQLFLNHVAQTSDAPIGIEMVKAQGVYLYDVDGKAYIDAISGFSVANIGHGNPAVIKAVQAQSEAYMHLIVYGEFIQQPQVAYAQLLTQHLPSSLNCVYFTNSGAEATEGAMKLAKRATNRSKIISFNKSYHGSTQGALSVMGDEYWRNAYRPLLPGIDHFDYGTEEAITAIDATTACVIMETVQAEAGVVAPSKEWIQAIRRKCTEQGVLLILDEIQSGFGRTGTLWAFEQFGIIPDILLLGKALGGGMPLGAFIADKQLMGQLTHDPVLGHITTFGGHPVSCAAGKAAMEVLLQEKMIGSVQEKQAYLLQQIQHPKIKAVRSIGLWMAVEFDSFDTCYTIIKKCIAGGMITDWFLFAPHCMRIAPPLAISMEELNTMCNIILDSLMETD